MPGDAFQSVDPQVLRQLRRYLASINYPASTRLVAHRLWSRFDNMAEALSGGWLGDFDPPLEVNARCILIPNQSSASEEGAS